MEVLGVPSDPNDSGILWGCDSCDGCEDLQIYKKLL